MGEEQFVQQLLLWAPDTALDGLGEQMRERFGTLAEGRRALQQIGLRRTSALSSCGLDAALRTAGLKHCDVPRVLSTVACVRPETSSRAFQGVTLDDMVSAIRTSATGRGEKNNGPSAMHNVAQAVVRNDMGPFWQQLHALKTDLRRGLKEPKQLGSSGRIPLSPVQLENGDCMAYVVNSAMSNLREHAAQNEACRAATRLSSKRQRHMRSHDSRRSASSALQHRVKKVMLNISNAQL